MDEKWNAPLINNRFTLAESSRGNIGEGPCSLQLQLWVLLLLNILDEFGNESSIDNGLNRGEIGNREYFSDANEPVVLLNYIWVVDGFHKFRQSFEMISDFEKPKAIEKGVTFKFLRHT